MSQLNCLQGPDVVRAVSFRAGPLRKLFGIAVGNDLFAPDEMRIMAQHINECKNHLFAVVFPQGGLRFDGHLTTSCDALDKHINEMLASLPLDKQRFRSMTLKPASASLVDGSLHLEHVQLTVLINDCEIVMKDLLPVRLASNGDIAFSGNKFPLVR